MLLSLRIQNLILVEKAEIFFSPGLNIFTGETGSGKSAILSAIALLSGERSDIGLIRKEAPFAVVEAELRLFRPIPELNLDLEHPITVRRELHASGKSRCFIEDAQVTLSFFRAHIGPSIERIDQNSSHDLCSLEAQREMLDAYADLAMEVSEFSHFFAKAQEKAKQLQEMERRDGARELEWAQKDLALLDEVQWKPGEEEALAAEHTLLSHAQELLTKTGSIASSFWNGEAPLLSPLTRALILLEQCTRFDARLKPIADAMKNALLELEEAAHSLSSYVERLDADPIRLETIEKRLAVIDHLKRRFPDPEKERQKLLQQIEELTHFDEEFARLKSNLEMLSTQNLERAKKLTEKRRQAAPLLEQKLTQELQSLNLPHVRIEISIAPKSLSPNGADAICFLFSANSGVPPVPLEECASGGELSRFLLALKILLSEKAGSDCLVFDEIDSNVGGQTAAILGEKFKQLAQKRQVICVTHFVQVARAAMEHFLVAKTEEKGKTYTRVSRLSLEERKQEYQRMLGQPSD